VERTNKFSKQVNVYNLNRKLQLGSVEIIVIDS